MKNALFLLVGILFTINANAQFSDDTRSKDIVEAGLDKLYNLEFREAEAIFKPVFQKYGNHPIGFLLKALLLQYEFAPIESNKARFTEYLKHLESCEKLAKEMYDNNKYKSDATFYLLASHGYISRAFHDRKDYLKAGFEAKKAYGYLKEGFALAQKNPEFYFTNGLYRYYRMQYPETHPSIKPIIYFFADGNKSQGLGDLRKSISTAVFTQTEAAFILAGICLKYENRPREAANLTKKLNLKYPQNPDFLLKYTEALIANGQSNLAIENIKRLKSFKGADYQMASLVFSAEIDLLAGEKDAALSKFANALEITKEGRETPDLKSMAFLGLANLYLEKGQSIIAKEYFKKCLEVAEYTEIRKKANLGLKKV